jgi:hypothetical protein
VLAKHWRHFHGPERGPVFHRGFSLDAGGTIRTHDGVKEAKLFDIQAKSGICGPCNNGWMSSLEVAVRPKLEHLAKPLAEGTFTFLTANTAARLELHRWAAKTSVVIDRMYSDPRVASSTFARGVMESEGPWPMGTWIAVIDEPRSFGVSTRVTPMRVPEGEIQYRLCLFAIHRVLTITLMWETDLTVKYLNAVNPDRFFGPGLFHAPMLPAMTPLPGPELQPIKDEFDEWMRARLEEEIQRQFVEGTDEDRTRLWAWVQQLQAEAVVEEDPQPANEDGTSRL